MWLRKFLPIVFIFCATAFGQIAVVPFNPAYPFTSLSGSTRQVATQITNTVSGVVSTSGTGVPYVSGTHFIAGVAWVGSTISINSVNYKVSSVASTTSLTLTTSAGTQSSVAYSDPAICSTAAGQVCTGNWSATTTGGQTAT